MLHPLCLTCLTLVPALLFLFFWENEKATEALQFQGLEEGLCCTGLRCPDFMGSGVRGRGAWPGIEEAFRLYNTFNAGLSLSTKSMKVKRETVLSSLKHQLLKRILVTCSRKPHVLKDVILQAVCSFPQAKVQIP
uniref:Uncharacterized protein n=1 Tax=Pipistrellus kuhlii TaxID=59472 RepID=A0A7J7XAW6_PIPKU|nr:hypothetical protein mPipKuh1_010594 [Pipistrellus kuhlii]